jgi:hypothetical protein
MFTAASGPSRPRRRLAPSSGDARYLALAGPLGPATGNAASPNATRRRHLTTVCYHGRRYVHRPTRNIDPASAHGTRAGQPTLNNARRRRPAGTTMAHLKRDDETSSNSKPFCQRSTAESLTVCTADLRAARPFPCRAVHRICLTLPLSCGARTQPRARPQPPARRQLQRVVSPPVANLAS